MPEQVKVHRVDRSSSSSDELSAWVGVLADWLDTRYRIPGTSWRFGLDGLIGLLPVAGDSFTALVGSAMLLEAFRIKARPRTVAKMLFNLAADWVLGLIPGADLILDVAFKANLRNAKLLQQEVQRRASAQVQDQGPSSP